MFEDTMTFTVDQNAVLELYKTVPNFTSALQVTSRIYEDLVRETNNHDNWCFIPATGDDVNRIRSLTVTYFFKDIMHAHANPETGQWEIHTVPEVAAFITEERYREIENEMANWSNAS